MIECSSDKMRFNVVMRPWRVVYVIDGAFEPQTIRYTIEAESWNKAYLRASDEREQIAALLGTSLDNVRIDSVTAISQS